LNGDFGRLRPYISRMTKTKAVIKTDPSVQARQDLLAAMLAHVPFDGWTRRALRRAVKDTDLPKGADALYFPGGALEVIAFWSQACDEQVKDHLASLDQDNMKIRDKVTQGVLVRLEAIGKHEVAARRAISRLALPDAVGHAPQQIWATADTIWRAIGDTSTDINYYSKRTILSGVISSSMLSWLADDSDDKAKARRFLDNRIANVMQIEKVKWEFKKRRDQLPNPAEVLGRLRYGKGRRRRRG